MLTRLLLASAVCAALAGAGPSGAEAEETGLVALADVAPRIIQDIRYATSRNFMAQVLPGYGAGKCLLRRQVARALARVQADLANARPPLGLKVFDCYRPMRAVRAMVKWTQWTGDVAKDRFYFPGHSRGELIKRGYISSQSSHARGVSVDLTLVALTSQGKRAQAAGKVDKPSKPTSCRDGGGDPNDRNERDMGTTFDCFDPTSATWSSRVIPTQRENRFRLVSAMARRGFRNYSREWWHFTFGDHENPRALDIVIK